LLGRKARLLVTVPAATALQLELETPLSSKSAAVGDDFTARLASPVVIEGIEALPSGSTVGGHVAHAQPAKKVGRARLTLELDQIVLPSGEEIGVDIQPLPLIADSTKKKDRGIVARLAGAGAVVGGVIGGVKGAAIGAGAGSAVGGGIAFATKGDEIVLDRGTSIEVDLASPLRVTVEKPSGTS
jgi:hypothetical protein